MISQIRQQLGVLETDPYSFARAEAQDGPVVGITPMHFPEELVAAAGALPVVLQENPAPVTTGWSHIFPHFCGFARSNVDAAAKGELDFLSAIVVSDMCVQTRTAFNIVARHTTPRSIYVWWPLEYQSGRWMDGSVRRLERCKGELEDVTGRRISEDDIRESIAGYNRRRRLLRTIDSLRRERSGAVSARDMQLLVQAAMVTPPSVHEPIFTSVIEELDSIEPRVPEGPRILLSGHMCHAVRPDIIDLVEDLGATVVGDDLYTGTRYYAADLPESGSVMETLALRYFAPGVPCPTKCGPEGDWAQHLLSLVKETGAQGVISLIPKHCEPHMFSYPWLKQHFEEAGIPHILLETEHEVFSLEGTKTRIQALIESLKGARR